MNHVKKMILVPHESVERMRDPLPSTPRTQMASLDTEMDYILRKEYADASEKWKKYNEVLQRYLFFANESRKPISMELKSVTDSKEETKPDPNPMRKHLSDVIPKTLKDQAVKIFDYLSRDGTLVTWDTAGEVFIKGIRVPHSNIIDLISDLTRSRKNFNPQGVDSFMGALARMNIPLDLVGNQRRRAAIQHAKQTGRGVLTQKVAQKMVELPQKLPKSTRKPVANGWKAW